MSVLKSETSLWPESDSEAVPAGLGPHRAAGGLLLLLPPASGGAIKRGGGMGRRSRKKH